MIAFELPPAAPPEFRFDPVGGHWVAVAPERAARPVATMVGESGAADSRPGNCPFCPGNEAQTPPALWTMPAHAGSTEWFIRVFPNSYPAARPIDGASAQSSSFIRQAGHGVHEVVVERPEHRSTVGDLSQKRWLDLLCCYRQRVRAHSKRPGIGYVSVFRNCGYAAGASQFHAHSQVLATAPIPAAIANEHRRCADFLRDAHRNLLDAQMEAERADGTRVLLDQPGIMAVCPFAGRFPFETWIVPTAGDRFADAADESLTAMAAALKQVVAAIEAIVPQGAYNLYLHDAPVGERAPGYRWHFEIVARFVGIAGFELGGGAYVNPFPPEWAAACLRRVLT